MSLLQLVLGWKMLLITITSPKWISNVGKSCGWNPGFCYFLNCLHAFLFSWCHIFKYFITKWSWVWAQTCALNSSLLCFHFLPVYCRPCIFFLIRAVNMSLSCLYSIRISHPDMLWLNFYFQLGQGSMMIMMIIYCFTFIIGFLILAVNISLTCAW